ncbi:MAG TPA: hypothetical protein C5S51_08470 [Methanosarcinaceae archaeon]|nr:hypothetical protein [Methanosarcinaceae archaeon]
MSKNKSKFTTVKSKSIHQKLDEKRLPRGYQKLCQPHSRDEKPNISLKYVDLGFKSFDDLKNDNNLRKLDGFISKLHNAPDWSYVFRTFNRTPTTTNKAKDMMNNLGFSHEQTEMFHLSVSDKFRVHGFIRGSRFKLVWLDPNHEINKE